MDTPKSSARGWSRAMSGRLSPRSHLLTALSDMYNRSAKSFWVMPRRSWDRNVPNCSLSISYIAGTSLPVRVLCCLRFVNRLTVEF